MIFNRIKVWPVVVLVIAALFVMFRMMLLGIRYELILIIVLGTILLFLIYDFTEGWGLIFNSDKDPIIKRLVSRRIATSLPRHRIPRWILIVAVVIWVIIRVPPFIDWLGLIALAVAIFWNSIVDRIQGLYEGEPEQAPDAVAQGQEDEPEEDDEDNEDDDDNGETEDEVLDEDQEEDDEQEDLDDDSPYPEHLSDLPVVQDAIGAVAVVRRVISRSLPEPQGAPELHIVPKTIVPVVVNHKEDQAMAGLDFTSEIVAALRLQAEYLGRVGVMALGSGYKISAGKNPVHILGRAAYTTTKIKKLTIESGGVQSDVRFKDAKTGSLVLLWFTNPTVDEPDLVPPAPFQDFGKGEFLTSDIPGLLYLVIK